MAHVTHQHLMDPDSSGKSPQRDTLKDRFLDWRARMLRNPRFIRWATRFPLTQPLSQAKTRDMFDIVAGFVYTQILTTCIEVRLLDHLSETSLSPQAIGLKIGLDEDATMRLLRAAAALDLVSSRSGGRYGLGELGAALLGNPGVSAMVEHHRDLYEDLRDPLALLKDASTPTHLSRYWAYAQAEDPNCLPGEDVGAYSKLMAASQGFVADEILSAYRFSKHQKLLDVGGGEGRFAQSILENVPNLQVGVFDLPSVAERARNRLATHPEGGRFTGYGGDFFNDSLPGDADIVTLVRILHDHDDDKALKLLVQVRQSLQKGQKLLVAEPMADTKGAQRAGDAYFGFYLLAMRSGRPRTEAELRAFLERTGFGRIEAPRVANPLLTRVLVAQAV